MPISPTVVNFFITEVFWCNFIRFLVFKVTNFSIPLSALYGIVGIAFLVFCLINLKNIRLCKYKLKVIVAFLVIAICFFSAKFFLETTTNLKAFGLKDIATIWSYIFLPVICMGVGLLSQEDRSQEQTLSKIYLYLTVLVFFVTTAINVADIVFYGSSMIEQYANFATTAPAFLGQHAFSRITGAYFSSIDFVFSATALLFLLKRYRGISYSIARLAICLLILLTFTRNAYVLAGIAYLVNRFGLPSQRKYNLLICFGILACISSLVILGIQLQSENWNVSEGFSSIATRIASWLVLIVRLSASPQSFLFGLGVAQNYFGTEQIGVYAIDNMYFEVLSISGFLGFSALIMLLKNSLHILKEDQNCLALFSGAVVTAAPVFGVFNNFLGWAMFSVTLSVILGSKRLGRKQDEGRNSRAELE